MFDKKINVKYSYEFETEAQKIAKDLNILLPTARLLCSRNILDTKTAEDFLCDVPVSEALFSPFLICDIDIAVKRILKAAESGEKVVIYGDYDVDGITSVSLLYLYLKELNINPEYYIPNRITEGYGTNNEALKNLAERGAKLIITVDTGTTAIDEVEYAKTLNVDMIVTDHHECHATLPSALAVVNPMREDSKYPFKTIAGVAVVFKLICAIEMTIKKGQDEKELIERLVDRYSDLVAIGTIADVMPLISENRFFVKRGLKALSETERPGLIALFEKTFGGVDKYGRQKKVRKITSSMIGYSIAPRMNAVGRLDNASRAVELCLTESMFEAEQLAAEMCEANRMRQAEENKIYEMAYEKISREIKGDENIIILHEEGWHHGIVGIVASRITEDFNIPTILISFDNDMGKGSGRSIHGINIVEALSACGDLLIRYGGHELAAGLTIERKNLSEFVRRMDEYIAKVKQNISVENTIDVDVILDINDVTLKQAIELERLEPFGSYNPTPQFLLMGLKVENITSVGNGKHTKLVLSKDGKSVNAVLFGRNEHETGLCEGDTVNAVFNLSVNDFQGVQSVQLLIKEIQLIPEQKEQILLDKETYYKIKQSNDTILNTQSVFPSREDFAIVYQRLKQITTFGEVTFSPHCLYRYLRKTYPDMSYTKIRYILDIFLEMNLISLNPIAGEDDFYRVNLVLHKTKVNIEKSSIYKKLKSRQERIIN